ncbi:MAG TPA: uroporphyrinogen-III synthase [Euzebya sp.]|nr:uroporphyrinogen-III synthase [Euzebya sp.]
MKSTVVAVTGARRGRDLVEAFARRGARVVHAPMLSGDHPAPDADIAADTEMILALRPQWVVATTGVGMRLWLEAAERSGLAGPLVQLMSTTRCIARSAKAEGGLAATGIKAAWTAPKETDATVAAWLIGRAMPGDGIAVQLHGGQPRAYESLSAGGLDLVSVMPYRTGPPTDLRRATALVEALLAEEVDVLTFTSPGAVRNLIDVADAVTTGGADRLRLVTRARTAVAAVGPVTAGTCEDAGLPVRMSPGRYRSMDLVREVEAWVARQPYEQATDVVLNPDASTAIVDDIEILLGKREYLVLATLSRRGGTVCRAEELLVQGWGHEMPDPGTVKHQVARLRRKLDGTSVTIQTVRGVGYRLVRRA